MVQTLLKHVEINMYLFLVLKPIMCFFWFYFDTFFCWTGVGLVWVGRASQSKAITGSVWTLAHTCWVSHSLFSLCVKSNTYFSNITLWNHKHIHWGQFLKSFWYPTQLVAGGVTCTSIYVFDPSVSQFCLFLKHNLS